MKPPLVEANHVAYTSRGGGRPNWLPRRTSRSKSTTILALLPTRRSRLAAFIATAAGTSRGWWGARGWEGIGALRIWDWEIRKKGDSIEVPFLFIPPPPPCHDLFCFSLSLIYMFVIFLCFLSFTVNWSWIIMFKFEVGNEIFFIHDMINSAHLQSLKIYIGGVNDIR